MIILIIYLAVAIFFIARMWKAFEKAGEPGWAILVPIYNIIVMFKIGGRTDWWAVIIPFYNIYVMWQLSQSTAKNYGKDSSFGIGLFFLGGIFWAILGYGDAKYVGAAKASNDDILDA